MRYNRYPQMNGLWDDMYAGASGAAGSVANELQSFGNWVGQEFNTILPMTQWPFSSNEFMNDVQNDPNAAEDLGLGLLSPSPTGPLAQVENAAKSVLNSGLLLVIGFGLLFVALEARDK